MDDKKPADAAGKKAKREEKKIIRFLDTNLDSSLPIEKALRKVKGIGFMFSHAICVSNKIDPHSQLGSLSGEQIAGLEEKIKNPSIPEWMLNRRKDPRSGKNAHISSGDIAMNLREDVSLLKKIRSYRGIRHETGLPVRGQRTRSSFRTKKAVGVVKKKALAQKSGKKQ